MNKEELKEALREKGIEAKEITVTKNGVLCTGFSIMTENKNVSPVIYYSQEETVESFLEKVNEAVRSVHEVDFSILSEKEYVAKNVFVCAQKKSDEDLVKREYLNLEIYLRIRVLCSDTQAEGSFKVNPRFLSSTDFSEEKLWELAVRNSADTYEVKSMASILGLPEKEFPNPFSVVTTADGTEGAGALYYPEVFREYCEQHGSSECLILPSSTQELLILTKESTNTDIEGLARMVQSVNESEVDPILRLEPAVYRYDLDSDTVAIAYLLMKEGL